MGNSVQTILKPGDVIGKYQVVRCLGIGGMGEVHLVLHQQLNVYRALKLLRTEAMTDDQVFSERFMREARIASRIQHPNIVSVMDVENDTSSGFCYIVMEYVDGSTLETVLRDGPLSPDQAIHIIAEVAKGLAAASEFGLVHRDIKPSNIMISQDGQVKLSDLGIAKASGDDVGVTLTMANSVIGTPAYASPEQCRSAHDVDVRADIYSLGATLYEMVTGLVPFDGVNAFDIIAHVMNDEPTRPRRLNPNISVQLENLILRMMSKDPQQRPQTIAELQQLLKPFLATAADIPPELKNLIHERVEREVQARTSTVITAYRKKQTWERSIMLAVIVILLISIFSGIFRINRYQRQVKQLKTDIAQYQADAAQQSESAHSMRELRRLKTAEMLHRTEKKEYENRIAELQRELDRETRDHQKSRDELEQKISRLNAEVDRLKGSAPNHGQPIEAVQQPVPAAPQQQTPPSAQQPGPPPAALRQINPNQPSREEYRRKEIDAQRKLASARRMIIGTQQELSSDIKSLDAAKIEQYFRRWDISFEELSYIRSWHMLPMRSFPVTGGPILGAAVGYNLNSRGWDTSKIHNFLSQCFRSGYRFDFQVFLRFLTLFPNNNMASNQQNKAKRNFLAVLEFLLIQPDMVRIPPFIHFSAETPVKQRYLNMSFSYFAASHDFPGWLERIARQKRLNLTEPDKSGLSLLDRTYLHFYLLDSLTSTHLQCLKNLERYGARYVLLNESDRKLIAAIRESDPKKVERIIREDGADPRKPYSSWGNALFVASAAAIKYNPEIIRLLLKSGSPVSIVSISNLFRRSPLAAAVDNNDADLIRELLQRGAEKNDYHALQAACRRSNQEIAKLLLENGTRPGKTYYVSRTANGVQSRNYSNELLFDALENKNSRIAIMLIEKNVSLTARQNGKSPLEIAEQDPALQKVADLIRKKLRENPAAQVPPHQPADTSRQTVPAAPGNSNRLVEFARQSSAEVPDLTRWIKAPAKDWHIHFGQAWKEAVKQKKMILILQVHPQSFPVFLQVIPGKRFLFRHFVPLFYYYRPDSKAPEEQKRHIELTGQAAGMMHGWPQTKIFRTDGSQVTAFSGFSFHSEKNYMSILTDVAAGNPPRALTAISAQAIQRKQKRK